MKTEDVTILVVDDEVDLCNLVAMRLQREGYNVLKANSGNEALKIIENEEIDLVVSDIRMPDGDGAYLLDKARDIDIRKPAFLFVTGFTDIPLDEAYNKGAEALLKKPIDFGHLVDIVKERLMDTRARLSKKSEPVEGPVYQFNFPNLESGIDSNKIKVGSGGVFVSILEGFPKVQDAVNFEISFDDGRFSPIKGKAICRWTRTKETEGLQPGIGLEFLELDEASAMNVNELVNENKIRAYIPCG